MRKLFTLMLVASSVWVPANPGNAFGQQPIVGIDVKPTTPKFGPWSQPTVLRNADDAAKLFDKDALDALKKKVDFQKQFVLVFAWNGSGGDKLSYVILESLPEQIAFSMKPGLTRDLRRHVQVFALRSNVKWSAAGRKGGGEKPLVRPLKFKPADPIVIFKFGRKASATKLADAAAVENMVGKASAKALIEQVNFDKEMIVFVSWNTGGPPDGKLMHEIKGSGDGRTLTFYVQGPAGGGARGRRLRIGADFFAAPRGVALAFDAKER